MIKLPQRIKHSTRQAPNNQSIEWYKKVIANNGLTDPIKGKSVDYCMQSLQDELNKKLAKKDSISTGKQDSLEADYAMFKLECRAMIAKIREAYKRDIREAYQRGIQDSINRLQGIPF